MMNRMELYSPTSRRPIAEGFRATARGVVDWCVRRNVHPDAISYGSMGAALVAGVGFYFLGRWPWLLLIAPLFCYVRLWLNMLDGMVALASGKASWRGEILNDLPDRVSDIVIFVGVAHSGLCNPFLGYWCAIAAVLTAYVGMFGQAVGVQREFSGVMSKPWRMVWLHVGCIIAFFVTSRFAGLTVLDWTCVLILVGCGQTVWIRLKRIFEALKVKRGV